MSEAKKCLTCKKIFNPRYSEGKMLWKKRKYCSGKCWYDRNLIKQKKCKQCSIIFRPESKKGGLKFDVRQYCSITCVVTAREESYKNGVERVPSTHTFGKKENNPNWRGGVTSENAKERKTAKYKHWRNSIFERDNYTCQFCSKRGGELNADHIKPFAFYKSLRYELSNGRTLCVPCHRKTFFGNKYVRTN